MLCLPYRYLGNRNLPKFQYLPAKFSWSDRSRDWWQDNASTHHRSHHKQYDVLLLTVSLTLRRQPASESRQGTELIWKLKSRVTKGEGFLEKWIIFKLEDAHSIETWMTYIRADGSVVDKRSWYRLSIITDIFWGIVDTIGLLGSTLIYPNRPVPRLRRSREPSSGGETLAAFDASLETELWSFFRKFSVINECCVMNTKNVLLKGK